MASLEDSQQAKRNRKKPDRLAEADDYSEPKVKSSVTMPPIIPSLKWSRFPQYEVDEELLSKKGKPFNGQYLLKDQVPDDFDVESFYSDNPTKRWAIICSGNTKARKGTAPLENPFKIAGKTSQTLVSSLWISKCGRFHLYPDPQFRFEGDDADNECVWMPAEHFTEYHCLPKSASSYLFLNPTDWETAMTKLEMAVKTYRDVSSSDATIPTKKCNKRSPVKLEPILVPLREREREEAKRKSLERKIETKRFKKAEEEAAAAKKAAEKAAEQVEVVAKVVPLDAGE
jgi:hypothetical protein